MRIYDIIQITENCEEQLLIYIEPVKPHCPKCYHKGFMWRPKLGHFIVYIETPKKHTT